MKVPRDEIYTFHKLGLMTSSVKQHALTFYFIVRKGNEQLGSASHNDYRTYSVVRNVLVNSEYFLLDVFLSEKKNNFVMMLGSILFPAALIILIMKCVVRCV